MRGVPNLSVVHCEPEPGAGSSATTLGASELIEISTALVSARYMGDLRRVVLPVLRREIGLASIAISIPGVEPPVWLAAGEPMVEDEIAMKPALSLDWADGRLVFTPKLGRTSEEASLRLRQVLPLIATIVRRCVEFEALYRAAVTDIVTGLYNRRFLDEALVRELASAQRYGREVALLALDLDGFKDVNDQLGHMMGDCALRAVADVLRRTTRASDLVARTGGDEFLVLMPFANAERALILAERILRRIQGITVPGNVVTMSASIGIVAGGSTTIDAADLVRVADGAMYEAKRCGKSRIVVRTEPASSASSDGVRQGGWNESSRAGASK
jgi:diguanylate cyclase (GGDEF)-like protein